MSARVDEGVRGVLRWGRDRVRRRRVLACAVAVVTERSPEAARCEGEAFGSPADVVALAAYLLVRVRDDARAALPDAERSADLARVEGALALLTGPCGRSH